MRFFKLTDLIKHSIQLAQKLASIFYKGFFEQKSENGKNILSDAAAAISNKMTERKITGAEVEGIGIGVPGPVDPAGVVHRCINIGWGIVDIKQELNRLLPDIPNVAAANDANVAALGELWQGGAKGCSSAVMITVGTGIGGGVVINGKIIAGANGGAGEIGHITVKPDETVACNCGKCGCFVELRAAKADMHCPHEKHFW